jgi:hypothetical protein
MLELEQLDEIVRDDPPDLVSVAQEVASKLAGKGTGTPEKKLDRLCKQAAEVEYVHLGDLCPEGKRKSRGALDRLK